MKSYEEAHVQSAGILTAAAGRSRIVAFDDALREHLSSPVRATAMVLADPASQALQETLDRLAPSDVTVLIFGETGTGKELVARYLHAGSARRAGPFVAVNCGALSESLAESELFGHQKGAFTGAHESRAGWFEAARGGTILLDEISELPLHLQVKLLRVLQEQEVTRVGSRTSVPIDVRVIAATNVDLRVAVSEKRFRKDLFFRLNVAGVSVLPLRQRSRDIAPLATHFLAIYKERLKRRRLDFSPEALDALEKYLWPGNIRELENVVHYAVHMAEDQLIRPADLKLDHDMMQTRTIRLGLEERVGQAISEAMATGETDIFNRAVASIIQSAFDNADQNQVHTAVALGISRNSLRTQLSRLGMIEPRPRNGSVSAPSQPRILNIGYQKYGTSSILKCKGTLEHRLAENHIMVKWREFSAGPQLLEALHKGEIDFGTTGEAPPIFAQAAGVPLLYLAHDPPAPSGEGILVRVGSDIETVQDLRQKRVGFNVQSNVHYLLIRALQRSGLTVGDIAAVDIAPDKEPLHLLETGEIDAWVIWDPLLSAAQHTGKFRILADGQGLVPNRQFYLGRQPYVKSNPGIIETLLQELQIAGEQAVRHSASMAKIWANELSIEAAVLEPALRRMTHGARPLDRSVIQEQQIVADTLYLSGLLTSSVLVSDIVYPA